MSIILLIGILSCYRVARLITVDDGPFDILLEVRAKLGAYDYGEDGRPETNVGRLVSCPYCVGIWLALLLAIVLFPLSIMTPVYWLAIAGGQSFLESVTPEDDRDSNQGYQAS